MEQFSISPFSQVAQNLKGSDILKVANMLRELTQKGERVCNLSVGDFSPKEFQIPAMLKQYIIEAYQQDETNYPPSFGTLELRKSVQELYKNYFGLDYALDEIQISSGSRPIAHSFYTCILDPHSTVLYPVPSWNNDLYTILTQGNEIKIVTKVENGFHPTRAEIEPHIKKVQALALCSPCNPTGTMFSKEAITGICELVLEENERRAGKERPLYLMYDSVYWMLTFGQYEHYNPVCLYPKLKDYTVIIDGISKCFAATGVRVGWGLGPKELIAKMTHVVAHAGAWAPRAEQIAVAKYLYETENIHQYITTLKMGLETRLDLLYKGLTTLKESGFAVDAVDPQGAMYLSARFNLFGKTTPEGKVLESNADISDYLLRAANLGIVPFQAFGYYEETGWFRMSVGAVSTDDIEWFLPKLKHALSQLR